LHISKGHFYSHAFVGRSNGPTQFAHGKPPLPSQGGVGLLAQSNVSPSASYPPPLMANASAASAAVAASSDQQNWLWKYRLSASRCLFMMTRSKFCS
jgi:hypothetical protein